MRIAIKRDKTECKKEIHSPTSFVPDYRPDIDGLRAVAVLSVVVFHSSSILLPGGFVGVDVFFVISGYLISQIILNGLARGRFSFWEFYARRIKRIFPSLIVVLAAVWAIGYTSLSAPEMKVLGKHIFAGSIFLSNFALWMESGYFDSSALVKPLIHLWSLGVEEQFYLFWPVVLTIAWRRRTHLGTAIALIAFTSFAVNIYMVSSGSVSGAFYLPWCRFWELMIGCGLAWSHHQDGSKPFRDWAVLRLKRVGLRENVLANTAAWTGSCLILFAFLFVSDGKSFPGWWALFPTIGAALLIGAGQQGWVNREILSHKWIVAIGLISYPLYLWHWPLIVYPRMDGYNHFIRILLIALAFLMAWLTYRYIERPIRFGKRRTVTKFAPVCLAMMLVSLGALGGLSIGREGFEERFPTYINRVLSYDRTIDLSTWRVGECFLMIPSSNETRFSDRCIDADYRQRPDAQVLLWGDSVAASLYPGFAHVKKTKHFSMAQFTATNCPPFLDYDDVDNKHCRESNVYISNEIRRLAPHTVFLSAYWLKFYRNYDVDSMLGQTVSFLRRSGVKEIVVIGPLPLWQPSLPRIIFLQYKRDLSYPPPWNFGAYVGVRLADGLKGGYSTESAGIESRLEITTRKLGATYASALKSLCSDAGCLSRVGDSYEDITSFDTMHLTVPAAEFLIKRIFEDFGS